MERKNINSLSGVHKRKSLLGFTIVELVIVIAVIAILAAVLIPTFSNVISKARISAIKENTRNRYVEYFTEYGDEDGFIDDLIIKHKEVDCVVFINGQMLDDIYTLEDAIEVIKTQLNNSNLNVFPNAQYKDILVAKEEPPANYENELLIGFNPVTSNDSLDNYTPIIIVYQPYEYFPDFVYVGEYDEENQCYLTTDNVFSSPIFKIEEYGEYWLIKTKVKNDYKYLYMDFGVQEQGESHIYLGSEPDKTNIENYLWDIQITNEGAIIKTAKEHSNGYNYYLTYYPDNEDYFGCHFIVKGPIKIYKPMFCTID